MRILLSCLLSVSLIAASVIPTRSSAASSDTFIQAVLFLRPQLSRARINIETSGLSGIQRRSYVINRLKTLAFESQAPLLEDLGELQRREQACDIRSLWITNLVVVKIRADQIEDLMQRHPEIARINIIGESSSDPEPPLSSGRASPESPDEIGWGIQDIRAPEVWNLGYQGEGVLIALIDSGVDYEHPDLQDRIWVNPGEDINGNGVVDSSDWNGVDDDENGYIDDLRGWAFDLNSPEVDDPLGNGTAAAGIILGDGTGGSQTGVAPQARLMILKNYLGGETAFWEAQQYALEMGADIIAGGLVYRWHFEPKPDYAAFRRNADMLLAAGVVQVSSIGNEGDNLILDPLPFNVPAPANCPPPWLHPDQALMGETSAVISAGAYGEDHLLMDDSSIGPSAWFLDDVLAADPDYPYQASWPDQYNDYPYRNGQDQGLIKPDLCAPSGVPAPQPGGGYDPEFSGTEAAAPHVAGTLCLMLSAYPDADPEALARAVMISAVDMGIPGKDNQWGCGKLDAFEAVAEILLEIRGSLSGSVTNASSGAAVEGADITLPDEGMTIPTDSSGHYLLPGIPEGSYDVRFTADGYDTLIIREVRVLTGEITVLNAALADTGVGVSDPSGDHRQPTVPILIPPFPNPFNPETVFQWESPASAYTELTIYDISGRLVRTLVSARLRAGKHRYAFNASDLPSGIYFYRLRLGDVVTVGKTALIR
jgi:subtilisin family serine protease